MKRDRIDDIDGAVERREGDHLQYLLTAYLFDSLSPAGRGEVESHLSGCAACRAELEELRATLGRLERTLGEDPAPYSFDERRRERVLAAARRPGGSGWMSIWRRRPLLSAAASLLILCMLGGSALMPLFMCNVRSRSAGWVAYQSAPELAEYETANSAPAADYAGAPGGFGDSKAEGELGFGATRLSGEKLARSSQPGGEPGGRGGTRRDFTAGAQVENNYAVDLEAGQAAGGIALPQDAPAKPMAFPLAPPVSQPAAEPAAPVTVTGTVAESAPERFAGKMPAPTTAATPAPAEMPPAGPGGGAAGAAGRVAERQPRRSVTREATREQAELPDLALGRNESRFRDREESFEEKTTDLFLKQGSPAAGERQMELKEQKEYLARRHDPAASAEDSDAMWYRSGLQGANRPRGEGPASLEELKKAGDDGAVALDGKDVQQFRRKLDALGVQDETIEKLRQLNDGDASRDGSEFDDAAKLRELGKMLSGVADPGRSPVRGYRSPESIALLHGYQNGKGAVAEWGLGEERGGEDKKNGWLSSTGAGFDPGDRGRGGRAVQLGDAERALRAFWSYRALDPELAPKAYFANPLPVPPPEIGDEGLGEAEFRQRYRVNPFVDTRIDRLSTFALDADTASFFRSLDLVRSGRLPPAETVRVEEFVNALPQEYAADPEEVFSVFSDGMPSIFGPRGTDILRIGIKARELRPGERRAAILTFAVDVSGSMAASDVARSPGVASPRLGLVQEALEVLIGALAPSDQVAVVAFSEQAHLVLPHTPARHAERIRGAVRSLAPRGGTNLEAGLDFAYRIAHEALSAGSLNRVVLLSDGVSTAGARNPEEILDKARVFARRGIYLSVIGIGKGRYDDRMLERLANEANGKYDTIDSLERAVAVFSDNLPSTLEVLAEDAKLQVDFSPAAVSRYRLLGYENRDIRDQDFRNDAVDAGEVGPGTTVTALYEIVRHPASAAPLGKVFIRYRDASTRLIVERDFPIPQGVLSARVEDASASLRLLACAAELAELLRSSYYARDGSFQDVILALQALEPEAPAARPGWPDLLELAARAQVLTIRNLQALAAEPAPAGKTPANPPAKQPAQPR